MPELVGVKSYFDVVRSGSLKRDALLVDRIAVPNLHLLRDSDTHLSRSDLPDDNIRILEEVEYLEDKGLLFAPNHSLYDDPVLQDGEYLTYRQLEHRILDEMVALHNDGVAAGDSRIVALGAAAAHLSARYIAIKLREIDRIDAIPLFSTPAFPVPGRAPGTSQVVEVVLNELPFPDDSVAWEQIEDFRADEDVSRMRIAIRQWMTDAVHSALTQLELRQKLEHLLAEYEHYMTVHRMKYQRGRLVTTVTTTADILGNLLSIRWGDAARALFELNGRKVALLEAELSAPGREVAYLLAARHTFDRK